MSKSSYEIHLHNISNFYKTRVVQQFILKYDPKMYFRMIWAFEIFDDGGRERKDGKNNSQF